MEITAQKLSNRTYCGIQPIDLEIKENKIANGWGGYKNIGKYLFDKGSKYLLYSAYFHDQENISMTMQQLGGQPVNIIVPKDFRFKLIPQTELTVDDKITDILLKKIDKFGMIGTDPEIFMVDKEGLLLPAFEIMNGKEDGHETPKKRRSSHEQQYYADGFAAEFNTVAENCLAYHVDSIAYGIRGVYSHMKNKKDGAKFLAKTVIDTPSEYLQKFDESHIQFGCEPSENLYGLKAPELPAELVDFRSAGGHLHFGITDDQKEHIEEMVRSLDMILGVACTSLFRGHEDPRRRVLYGMAGEYRRPDHGFEYRTLSNVWLWHPTLTHIVIDLSRRIIDFGRKGLNHVWKCDEKRYIDTIQYCNVEEAEKIIKENEQLFRTIILQCKEAYKKDGAEDVIYDMFVNGTDEYFNDLTDIETNWQLTKSWNEHSGNKNCCFANSITSMVDGIKI